MATSTCNTPSTKFSSFFIITMQGLFSCQERELSKVQSKGGKGDFGVKLKISFVSLSWWVVKGSLCLMKWVHFQLFGEPASVFQNLIVWTTGKSLWVNPLKVTFLSFGTRGDTHTDLFTVGKTEESISSNVWQQCLCHHLGVLWRQELFCLIWWEMRWNEFLFVGNNKQGSRHFNSNWITDDSCANEEDQLALFHLSSFNGNPLWCHLLANSTFKMLVAKKDQKRPVLKHGPRSLTYVRAFQFGNKLQTLILSSRECEMKVKKWEKWRERGI